MKRKIKKTLAIILGILIFYTIGCIISNEIITSSEQEPISSEQVASYKKAAQDIYEKMQAGSRLYEIPKGASLELTDTAIIISVADEAYRGRVIAYLENDKLVCVYDAEEPPSNMVLCQVMGICFGAILGCLFYIAKGVVQTLKEAKIRGKNPQK